jgi:hypothetical protein
VCVRDGHVDVVTLQVMSYDIGSKVCQPQNTLVSQVGPSAILVLLFSHLWQNTQLAFMPQHLLVPSGQPMVQ